MIKTALHLHNKDRSLQIHRCTGKSTIQSYSCTQSCQQHHMGWPVQRTRRCLKQKDVSASIYMPKQMFEYPITSIKVTFSYSDQVLSKHCLCGGGCCNDCGSLDTKEVGWGNLWQEEGGQWASKKLHVIVSIKRLWMFIKTFRTLVNHYNCSFDLNSNSPKLNRTYTSNFRSFSGPFSSPKIFSLLLA